MNYFFGVNNSEFKSEIQIPTFKNRYPNYTNISLFKGYAKDNKWHFEELKNNKINNDFFLLKNEEISNKDIFFLALKKDLINYNFLELKNFNNFTDTKPAYRANFKIILNNGGFSSYQSEYPFSMIKKRGTILSSVYSIANQDADKNYIFIKNIYVEPIYDSFKAYIVNIKNKKIEETISVKTNYTNSFELNKLLIKPEIFLVTSNYIGIPMYVSVKNKHVSFEHTHPPHEYILSNDKFEKISKIKKKINEIIS
jgi:hypothetical protein